MDGMGAIASCSWQPPEAVQVESEVDPTEGSSLGLPLKLADLTPGYQRREFTLSLPEISTRTLLHGSVKLSLENTP